MNDHKTKEFLSDVIHLYQGGGRLFTFQMIKIGCQMTELFNF